MGMIIAKKKPVAWPVVYVRPGDHGETERHEFTGLFHRPESAEAARRLLRPTEEERAELVLDVVARYAHSLEDVEIDGRRRGETREDVLALCAEFPDLDRALYQALLGSVMGVKLGNLLTPAATGPASTPPPETTGD